jgi:hypothetical protein
VEVSGGRLQFAHAETTAAQRRRRVGAPVVEQQLRAAYRLEGGAGAGPIHDLGSAVGRRDLGRDRHRLTGGPPAPQRQPDLTGEDDEPATTRHQQPPRQQLLGRGLRVVGEQRLPSCPGGRLASLGVDVLQHRPRRRRQRLDVGRDLVGRRRLWAARPEPTSVAHERLRDTAQRTDPAGRVPGQRQVLQLLQRGVDLRPLGVHDPAELGRSGLTGHDQGI